MDKKPLYIIGVVITALITLHIFATTGDVSDLRAEVADKYITRNEIEHRLDKIEGLIETLVDHAHSKN